MAAAHTLRGSQQRAGQQMGWEGVGWGHGVPILALAPSFLRRSWTSVSMAGEIRSEDARGRRKAGGSVQPGLGQG